MWRERLQRPQLRVERTTLMWEHLACLAHSERPAAAPLAKFTSLNFAQCVREFWVRAQSGPGLCCVCVCV